MIDTQTLYKLQGAIPALVFITGPPNEVVTEGWRRHRGTLEKTLGQALKEPVESERLRERDGHWEEGQQSGQRLKRENAV